MDKKSSVMESEQHSQAPPVVVFNEDDTFGSVKTSNPFIEFGHGNASPKSSQTPVEADLHGLGETQSSFMDSFAHDCSISKGSTSSSEVTVSEEDDDLGLENKSFRSSTCSSSSSSSFDENFFLMDDSEPRKSNVESINLLQLDEIRQLAVKDSDTRREFVSSNPVSPQPFDAPPASSLSSKSPKESPQIQVMERLEVPDPNRIPASVFARTKSVQPVEWSVQSNESLFSIHMGNNSFSRDQIFFMGRSQELGKYEDMFKFPNNTSGVVNNLSTPTGAITNSEKSMSGIGSPDAAAETMKEVIRETAEEHNKAKPPDEVTRHSTSTSQLSDGSGVSAVSFAFPILTKEGMKVQSPKVEIEKEKPQHQPLPLPQRQAQPQQQQQQQQQQPQEQPQLKANAAQTNCLSCLCCLFCR